MTQQFDPLWFCGPGDEAAQRQTTIAQAAYFRAQRRGFAPGHELEDWLAAEQEVYALIAGTHSTSTGGFAGGFESDTRRAPRAGETAVVDGQDMGLRAHG